MTEFDFWPWPNLIFDFQGVNLPNLNKKTMELEIHSIFNRQLLVPIAQAMILLQEIIILFVLMNIFDTNIHQSYYSSISKWYSSCVQIFSKSAANLFLFANHPIV